jgi:replicative DNA helicase
MKHFIYTPAESTTRYIQYAEALQQGEGLDYGCILDQAVVPLRPGEVEFVVARPGHGKSAWMAYRARRAARQLIARGEDKKKVVLYFSWEQPIEQMEANFQAGLDYTVSDIAWGRADIEHVKTKAMERVKLPIWLGGKSLADKNQRGPRMTIDAIFEGIRSLKDEFGVEPALICFDYLQIIPVQGKTDRQTEVTEATYQVKEVAIDVGCPAVVGVQAKTAVDAKGVKIPDMGEAWYTSATDHVGDKIFGVMKPIKMMDEGRDLEFGGHHYTVDDNLFLIKMTKQRMEKGHGKWAVHFDMSTMELKDYDLLRQAAGGER